MGTYISKGNAGFAKYTNCEYIDCNFNGVKDTLESLIKGVSVSCSVAEGIEYIHNHKVAPNFYNNEQSL